MRQRLGDAAGLTDFGANLSRLPPGNWSSQRHCRFHEDGFVYMLEGAVMLVEDEVVTTPRARECAGFPKGTGNGHNLIDRSDEVAVYIEIGSRQAKGLTNCSDVDMKSANADRRFVRHDGTPYSGQEARTS